MTGHITPQQLVRIAAAGCVVFAAAVAVIHGRRSEDVGIIVPFERGQADALATELARCRTITPDETVALENCRRAWAANRKHFFAPAKSTQTQARAPSATAGPAKSQDRVTPVEVQSKTR
jgi:conjugative transfer region protein TrbK